MKALSVRAPWWWFILHAGKDIENRDWPTKLRGTVYLHASTWWNLDQVCFDAAGGLLNMSAAEWSWPGTLAMKEMGGHIVGQVDIVDCVSESKSPWFSGDYGFVLANPVAFTTPIRCPGALNFFTPPDDVQQAIREQTGGAK